MLHDYCLHEMTNRVATTPNKTANYKMYKTQPTQGQLNHLFSFQHGSMSSSPRLLYDNLHFSHINLDSCRLTKKVMMLMIVSTTMSIRTLPATYKVDFSWDETNFFTGQNQAQLVSLIYVFY